MTNKRNITSTLVRKSSPKDKADSSHKYLLFKSLFLANV